MSVLTVVPGALPHSWVECSGGVTSSTDTTVRQLLALLKQLLGKWLLSRSIM